MIVRESINFERGLVPKDVLKLGGKAVKIYGADFEDPKNKRIGSFVGITPEGVENLLNYLDSGKDFIQREYWESNLGLKSPYHNFRFFTKRSHNDWLWMGQIAGKRVSFDGKIYYIPTTYGYVNENINFERGLDPKISMDVGKSHLDRRIMEETDWAIEEKTLGIIYEILELIRDYKGYPILVLKNKQHDSWPYRAISVVGVFGDYQETAAKALKDVKNIIDGQLNPMRESLDFERGLDPLKSLNIGREVQAQNLKTFLEDTLKWNGARVQIINNNSAFYYRCFPGQSVRKFLLKALEDYGVGGKYKVIATDTTSRGDPDGGEWHEYLITPKKSIKESINFERGMDPKQSMGIGRTVDILLAGEGPRKAQGFKALVLDPVDDPKVNPGKTIFWVQALEGENKGEKVIVRKFDEPFGKYWGLEWSLALGESVNFERGLDPIRAMDIGMFYFEVEFSGDIEDMEDNERMTAKKWNYNGIKIVYVEGNADEDSSELFFKLSDGDEIIFKQKSYMGPSRPDRADYAKISISSLNVNDFEVHDAWVDELSNGSIILATMRMYEDIKNQSLVKESVNFERGLEPKKAMGIGLTELEKKIIEETDWHENLEIVLQVAEVVKVILDYMGSPIVIIKLDPKQFAVGQEPYIGISKFDKTDLVDTEEIAEHDAKIDIENHYIRERDLKKMNLK